MLYKGNMQQSLDGEQDKFKELLRTRLIGCGWRDQMQMLCREIIRERGIHNVTVQDIMSEITAKGRALVPDSVKKELLLKIKTHLTQEN